MSHPYDATFAWPFPSLPVVIRQVGETTGTSVLPAQLDTGADATLVPTAQLRAVQADELYQTRLRSHWGEWRPVTVYLVDLEVAGHQLPGVEVVADDTSDSILLGRNVLNKLILLLDGPGSQADVLTRRPPRL
jgi:predicted aspartyl protease